MTGVLEEEHGWIVMRAPADLRRNKVHMDLLGPKDYSMREE